LVVASCLGSMRQPCRLFCLLFHEVASLPSSWDWHFAGTGTEVGESRLTFSEKEEVIQTVRPNTSFQRTLTRGGFGPLNSDR